MRSGLAAFGAMCLVIIAFITVLTWPLVPFILYSLFSGGAGLK